MRYDDGISDEIGGLDEQGLGLRRRGLPMPPGQFQGVGVTDAAPSGIPAPPPVQTTPSIVAPPGVPTWKKVLGGGDSKPHRHQ